MEEILVSITKRVTCILRATVESAEGTKYFIKVEDDAGETAEIPGKEAYDTFPVGAGLAYTQTLAYFNEDTEVGPK